MPIFCVETVRDIRSVPHPMPLTAPSRKLGQGFRVTGHLLFDFGFSVSVVVSLNGLQDVAST